MEFGIATTHFSAITPENSMKPMALQPTEGRLRTRGRVGALLEVGTGFHPELTGEENIYLNGAMLGMSPGLASHASVSFVSGWTDGGAIVWVVTRICATVTPCAGRPG